jgi:RND family efflux transporter MFP subunit
MTRVYRPGFVVVALLSLVAATVAGCGTSPVDEVESETVVSVKTQTATTGTIRGVVHATGVVAPAPGADLVVVAPESARIAEVPKAAGETVRRGDLLVRFDIPTAAADVQRQQAEVVRASATLDNAKATRTRAGELFDRGIAARREVEDATRALADAEAALAQARAALAASRAVAERATVRATFDGIVATRQHNPGDLVEPSASDPVLRVVDPRRLEVVASVPLSDVLRVERGAQARMADTSNAGHDVVLKVVSLPAAVDNGTATVPVRLGFITATARPVGMPVQVVIDAERHDGVVLVPAVAVVREGDETAVFVVAGEKAERRPVILGLTDGTRVEIVEGVKAGEAVIVDGQAGLPDGAAITATNRAESNEEPAAVKASGKGPK